MIWIIIGTIGTYIFNYLELINPIEISYLILKIPDQFKFYNYNLSNFILKQTADSISTPLSFIFNRSLISRKYFSTYSTKFRYSFIPLFISGNHYQCGHYIDQGYAFIWLKFDNYVVGTQL